MKVHCYYQPVASLQPAEKLIALWKRNWAEAGFEPVVLSEKDAVSHPGYEHFINRVYRYPTTNPKNYEIACFVRHLAMCNVGGSQAVLVDYDCFPNPKGPKPNFETQEAFLFLEPTRVPCAIVGTHEGFEDFCDVLCDYSGNDAHVSDMTIARTTAFPTTNQCIEHLCSGRAVNNDPGDGWMTAPMIHVSNHSLQKLGWTGRDKADCIERILRGL